MPAWTLLLLALTGGHAARHRFQTTFLPPGSPRAQALAKASLGLNPAHPPAARQARSFQAAVREFEEGTREAFRHEASEARGRALAAPEELPTAAKVVRRGRQEEQAEYGAPQEEEVDLHNKEFCVDVSIYEPVSWLEEEAEECATVFVKDCQEKTEEVCMDVSESRCQVVPYTECSLGMEPQAFTQSVLAPKLFTEKVCSQGKKVIPHVKMLPECRNVTKQNCVTLWETDEEGKQVWAGNEACEPVTWQECELVPKNVKFIVPEINCTDGQELWYHQPELVEDVRMTNTFTCEVKSTISCETQSRPDCKSVSYQECREEPVTNCEPKSVHKPVQELIHRKKCLLADDPNAEAEDPKDGYGKPAAPPVTEAPLPSYSG